MRREVERDAHALTAAFQIAAVERVRFLSRREPGVWRIVHGRCAYMVGCGPRKNGGKPGSVSTCGSARQVGGGVQRLDRDSVGRMPGQAVSRRPT